MFACIFWFRAGCWWVDSVKGTFANPDPVAQESATVIPRVFSSTLVFSMHTSLSGNSNIGNDNFSVLAANSVSLSDIKAVPPNYLCSSFFKRKP